MKKVFTFCLIGLIACNSNDSKDYYDKVNVDNLNFGNYYKIGKYEIEAPFENEPTKSMDNENDKIFNFQYRDLFVFKEDTFILGIGIYRLKDSSIKIDSIKFLDIMRHSQSSMIALQYKGLLASSDTAYFHGRYCISDKYKMTVLYQGIEHKQIYYTKIFNYNDMIVNLFAFTPLNDKCKIIVDGYFNRIKIK